MNNKKTNNNYPVHPLGIRAKVLFSSVFGPYAQDNDYGSRRINPMELYHNQVTRLQGGFSLRMFHRSFGLMMIQSNIEAPCTLLDYPDLHRFIDEISEHSYDIVGISAIIPNVEKVKKMCELIRKYLPNATIVIGGHVANKDNIAGIIDADYIVKGDGVRWFRRFLGQDEKAAINHPVTLSAQFGRIIGHTLSNNPKDTAAILIPSVGCPLGCNFCSTSALFGGKGKFVNFYKTGDELFNVMHDIEKRLNVRSFFVLDENFLLHRQRALRLLELIKKHNKSWSLMVFSSAGVIKSYSVKSLVELGVNWVWMGLEGEKSDYQKLRDVDTHLLVRQLKENGIRVLGSTIIGLEEHTSGNIDQVIDYAISHQTDFHQFMLYMPNPGTILYEKYKKADILYDESKFSPADAHGQYRFSYRHKNIPQGMEEQMLLHAFKKDFEVNGPSLARLIRTMLSGWQKYKNHPDRRIRDRFDWDVNPLRSTYAGAVWAMRIWYRNNKRLKKKMDNLLKDIYATFGWKTRLIAPFIGMYAYICLRREEKRLAHGWTIEPCMHYEKNAKANALELNRSPQTITAKKRRPWTVVKMPSLNVTNNF